MCSYLARPQKIQGYQSDHVVSNVIRLTDRFAHDYHSDFYSYYHDSDSDADSDTDTDLSSD